MSDRRCVLIADEEQDVRAVVAQYLIDRGFHVVQAASGLEMFLHLKREEPYAVVLDIAMPRLGGLHALKRLRVLKPSTRIVVYSAVLDPEIERHAAAAGAVAVLKKPGALESLAGAIEGDVPIAGFPQATSSVVSGRPDRELRILLIDDDPRVNDVLSQLLAQHGAKVFPVTNATDAFRLLAYGAPDAIFLDIRMPGLSGLDALPELRALAPDAKVVMVSGIADETTVKQAFARGAFDYMAKPLDIKHLSHTLETIRSMTAHDL